MTHIITNNCISCDRCEWHCPTNAIRQEGQRYLIEASLCNNCVGYYSVPQCAAACPTNDGCIPSLGHFTSLANSADYWELWSKVYDRVLARMKRAKNPSYWERWFAVYSQKISK